MMKLSKPSPNRDDLSTFFNGAAAIGMVLVLVALNNGDHHEAELYAWLSFFAVLAENCRHF